MVIGLEMTFLRCFFYNTLILLASAAITAYRHFARLITLSMVLSVANILMLYISNIYIFNAVRVLIFCLFPALALGKTSTHKVMTVLSAGLLFCGSSVATSQITQNIWLQTVLSSCSALAACGLLPVIRKRARAKSMSVKISRAGAKPISAFIDTGIECRQGLVVVLEKCCASSLLSDEEMVMAMRPENRATVDTVAPGSAGLPYVDVNDLCVYSTNHTKILPARIMLTDSMLPHEALISAANELEASV